MAGPSTEGTAYRAAGSVRRAGQGAADDDPLDLRRPLEDRVDLRVAVPLLHREVLDVAVPAQDLHGLLGHPHRGLAALQLRHRPTGRGPSDGQGRETAGGRGPTNSIWFVA